MCNAQEDAQELKSKEKEVVRIKEFIKREFIVHEIWENTSLEETMVVIEQLTA